jgi:hypothetical protein
MIVRPSPRSQIASAADATHHLPSRVAAEPLQPPDQAPTEFRRLTSLTHRRSSRMRLPAVERVEREDRGGGHSGTLAKATDDGRTDLLLSRIAPARRSPAKPPMPPRASALVTHRNSRLCRSEAERVQMAWRSSSTRCSPRRMLRAQNLLTPTYRNRVQNLPPANRNPGVHHLPARTAAGCRPQDWRCCPAPGQCDQSW